MLQITIPYSEIWDENKEEFIVTKEQTLRLEHSLVSLSKWEQKWGKPFLSKDTKTFEETIDYVRCMTITQNVDPDVYNHLTDENITEVNKYIESPMTATWFGKNEKTKTLSSRRPITNELIYCWMISFNISFECQKWHLNRLLTLINVCDAENRPKDKKMSQKQLMSRNAALNASRRKQLNTKG